MARPCISVVSDCGGQAMSRMLVRTAALFPATTIVSFDAGSIEEANGNIVDALDAGLCGTHHDAGGIILCNSAPRKSARATNGDAIVYARLNGWIVVSTLDPIAMLHKLCPKVCFWKIDVDNFVRDYLHTGRTRFNFRGLEVIPFMAEILANANCEAKLDDLSTLVTHYPSIEPCIWLVDTIEGRPTNLKLSLLRDEIKRFGVGKVAQVRIGEKECAIPCFERLTDIPNGTLGLYEGSSGLYSRRFLEIAVMGGSAAERLGVTRSGEKIAVSIT